MTKINLSAIWAAFKPHRTVNNKPGDQWQTVAIAICTLWDCAVEILTLGFFTSDARGTALFDWFDNDKG